MNNFSVFESPLFVIRFFLGIEMILTTFNTFIYDLKLKCLFMVIPRIPRVKTERFYEMFVDGFIPERNMSVFRLIFLV